MPTTTAQRRADNRSPRHGRRAKASRPTRPRAASDEWLTVNEVCTELKIGRRTFERWRALGTAPRAVRFAGRSNGPLRIRRSWLDEWIEDRP
jgi:excisionase family DNA binding protein